VLTQGDVRVATAARTLGLHRNQLRRWLEKNELDAVSFAAAAEDPGAEQS
jgi:transposase-like protein